MSAPTRRRPQFHPLSVAHVERLTDDAVAVTFVVSPELHGRPVSLAQWRALRVAGAWIVTDLPHLAAELDGNAALVPDDPWWAVHA